MTSIRNVLTATVTSAVAATVLAGCAEAGSSPSATVPASHPSKASARPGTASAGVPAQRALDSAAAAMQGLSSATMSVRSSIDGHKAAWTTAMTNRGACVAHIESEGTSMDMVTVDGYTYTRFDAAQGNVPSGGSAAPFDDDQGRGPVGDPAGILDGRWWRGPADRGQDREACELKALVASLVADHRDSLTTVGVRTVVGGASVIPLTGRDSGGTTTFYILAEGAPYIARIVRTGADASTADLTRFDEPVNAVAPPDFQILDVDAPER